MGYWAKSETLNPKPFGVAGSQAALAAAGLQVAPAAASQAAGGSHVKNTKVLAV